MKTGTLILICGLPGAGKTTLAKRLETERNAIRFCPDDWIYAFLKNPKDIPEMDRLRDPVEQQLWKSAQRLLQLGVTVVMENGFWPDWERAHYRDKARELGANVELHYCSAPHEELWKRIQKRNADPNDTSFELTETNLLKFEKKFNPPTASEGATFDVYVEYTV
jgi:predicted kinase